MPHGTHSAIPASHLGTQPGGGGESGSASGGGSEGSGARRRASTIGLGNLHVPDVENTGGAGSTLEGKVGVITAAHGHLLPLTAYQ